MISKEQAIAEIVALTRAHNISLEEITSAVGREQIEANKKDSYTLTRVFSYLGGIFVLFGLIAYTGVIWGSLNAVARILITLGPGIICLILSVVAASQNQKEKNITIFIILSALFQPAGLFVAVYEFSSGGGDIRIAALLIFGVLALQYVMVFLTLKRTSPLFFAIYFAVASFVNLADFLGFPARVIEFICGVSLLAVAYGLQRTPYNSICGFGYFVASIILLWMSFDILRDTSLELVYLAFVGFMLYMSTIVQSRSILATSAISMFGYLSYFTAEHFVDSVGWPVCLIILGFVFFGISSLTLKLSKRF